ncbi:hypothetical protein W97_07789 [Coniosporium apollinis CBS 100218]|uniref:General transcription and DNA repair factor IIH subunit TFB5 n=1 Tax=Coniosporium apollinis (strain CBS 100218) TaxID=1168221 RepID=R7Z3N3_CONA1|nr:uncharacterized protein W97_07789 [Coniosporium apollinis CBS 100218]EON68531.1 hypothetical protein W97_07789 [Coniosporium apollinis CBS 100218]
MVKALKGVLVQCDPSIKAILLKIDADSGNEYIIEDLDEETLFVKESKVASLKEKLKVTLRETVRENTDSDSE